GEVPAAPLAMAPVGVAAVAGPHVQRYEAEGVDLERQRLSAALGEVDGGVLGVTGAGCVTDVDLGPAELLAAAVGPDARGVVEDAEAVGLLLHDDDDRVVVEAHRHVQPPEAVDGGRLALRLGLPDRPYPP